MDSWLDRPLSVAGKIIVRDGEKLTEKLIHIEKCSMIPKACDPYEKRSRG